MNSMQDDNHIADEIAPGVSPMWYSELAKLDIPAPTWIVDKLIPDESISIISAPPAQYKTWLAFDLAIKVALGKSLFGQFETKQTNVLIVDEESGLARIRERLQKLGAPAATPIALSSYKNFQVAEASANSLIAYCNAHKIGLVVFDSLTRIHTGDENSAKDMSIVMGNLKRLVKEGVAVLLIHHNRKPGQFARGGANEMRGSGDILAACDVQISLKRKAGTNAVTVAQNKNRDAVDLAPFDLEINSDETSFWFEYLGNTPKQKSREEKLDEAIFVYLQNHGLSALRDIQVALKGFGKTKIANRLVKLAGGDELTLTIGARGRKSFDLPEEQADE
jgi:RecA-family ATPase